MYSKFELWELEQGVSTHPGRQVCVMMTVCAEKLLTCMCVTGDLELFSCVGRLGCRVAPCGYIANRSFLTLISRIIRFQSTGLRFAPRFVACRGAYLERPPCYQQPGRQCHIKAARFQISLLAS